METLSITYLTDLFYPYLLGGGERQFYEIARRMARRHEVNIITEKLHSAPEFSEIEGMKIRRVGIPHGLSSRSFARNLASAMFVPSANSDIVHANQGAFAFSLPFHRGSKFLTIHDLYFSKWHQFHPLPVAAAGRLVEFMMERIPGRIIAVSETTREKLAVAGRDAMVVGNGIELSKYRKGRKERIVLYLGRLVRYKRVDELISAFRLSGLWNEGYGLVIAGEGPERKRLEKLAKGLPVSFTGYVTEEDKLELLSRAEIFANPSEVEGFGIAALEALASGCKVVVKPLDCYSFCRKNCIMTRNFETGLRRAVGMKTRKVDLSMHDWDVIVGKLERLYRSSEA